MTRALLLLCLLLVGPASMAGERVTKPESMNLEIRLDALEKRVQALEAGR